MVRRGATARAPTSRWGACPPSRRCPAPPPSPRLCAEAMEARLTPGMTVLDLGTGSGILAIAAARLGAASALALDVDPTAVGVAAANVTANSVAGVVRVGLGSMETIPAGAAFNLVVANILARV